jgi:hypothetical protein
MLLPELDQAMYLSCYYSLDTGIASGSPVCGLRIARTTRGALLRCDDNRLSLLDPADAGRPRSDI